MSDMSEYKAGQPVRGDYTRKQSERGVPQRTFLFLALVGSSVLFIALVVMFIIWSTYNPPIENLTLPKQFTLSTLVLLVSSYLLTLCRGFFRNDQGKPLAITLASTLLCSLVFGYLQIDGWTSLYSNGHAFDGAAGTTFLYLITGLHFLHVFGGMIYLFFLNIRCAEMLQDDVRRILFFSDSAEESRLQLFGIYWHFVDALWVFLFLTFLFFL